FINNFMHLLPGALPDRLAKCKGECHQGVWISEPFAKQSFRPTSALYSKFYPWNINHMPVVKFFACLDFERKSMFCKRLN
ncbi:MAG TPA: hypothetical protein VK857_13495, partial [Desulforhopalus sp.]|nr:hypothetical protein [Desulforhopalus sp.]